MYGEIMSLVDMRINSIINHQFIFGTGNMEMLY